MRKAVSLLCLFFILGWCFVAPAQELSYRRITMKTKLKEFYRTGGREYLNKRVHMLIPAAVFQKKHKEVKDSKGRKFFLFANKSVPLLINPNNVYYKRLLRKLDWQKKKIQIVSVFGKIVKPSWDLKGRNYLVVYKLKTYGGSLKKI